MKPSPKRSTLSSPVRYSYHIPPPPGQFLCQPDPLPEGAESFPARACRAFQDYLESSGRLDDALSTNIRNNIAALGETIRRIGHVENTKDFAADSEIAKALSPVIESLTGGRYAVSSQPADRRYSQQGDRNLRTEELCRGDDSAVLSAFALEFLQPSNMLKHTKAMSALPFDFVPQAYHDGPESVLVRLFLHMFHACPNRSGEGARVGVLLDGQHAIFAERYEHPPNHHGLVISKLYSCFDGHANLPSVPLVATLAALSMPGIIIPQPPIPPQRLPSNSCSPLASRLVALVDLTDSSAALTNRSDDHKSVQSSNFSDSSAMTTTDTFNTLYFALSPQVPSTQPGQQFAALDYSPHAGTSTSSTVSASSALYRVPQKEALLLGRQLLHVGPDALSWRAQLVNGGPGYIAKIFQEEPLSLARAALEATAMKTVAMLCGDIVPAVHGLFAWPNPAGGFDEGGLLLLQDVGEALSASFSSFEPQDRADVWKIMTSLHECGIQHGDVDPRRFARGCDGILRVVDLGKVDLAHHCNGPSSCHELAELHSAFFPSETAALVVLPPD